MLTMAASWILQTFHASVVRVGLKFEHGGTGGAVAISVGILALAIHCVDIYYVFNAYW